MRAWRPCDGLADGGLPSMTSGRLPENVMHFARILRAAGLPVGPDRVIEALRAVDTVGLARRADLHAALAAVLLDRRDQQPVFDQAFAVFWRHPQLLERALKMILDRASGGGAQQGEPVSRRLAEALTADNPPRPAEDEGENVEMRASLTFSGEERLRSMDFEDMSADELAAARAAIARMRLGLEPLKTRRWQPDPRGRLPDPRASLRAGVRRGGELIDLAYREPRRRAPAIVVLCDISGSMSQYARLFLQFAHALTRQRERVHTFLFGTRLSNVTRQLRGRDPDVALGAVGTRVEDWSGGTRIGQALGEFNRRWARRLLAEGTVVLLVTDGLDRDAGEGIEIEIRRLHRLARRIIWLNPLLRYEGFEARAAGIRALLPHVDDFRPVHNLASLETLGEALAGGRRQQDGGRDDLRRAAGGR